MEKSFIVIKFLGDNAILYNEEFSKELLWPSILLPKDSKVGEKLNFFISVEDLETANKRRQSVDILNEILTVEVEEDDK